MIRYCISTATPIELVKKSNGEETASGIGADFHIEQMAIRKIISRPFNVTFYFTTEASNCLERLKNNLSDLSTTFMPIQSISPYYHVPQTLFSGKIQFVTGYNMSEGEQAMPDTATVYTNADLLKPSVYLWATLLLASLIAFVSFKVTLFCQKTSTNRMPITSMIKKQLARVFYHDSERFKWITLLYSLLCFFLITSFLCLYKTSHIIMEKPFHAITYQESLDHPSSLAFYYDQIAVVSSDFKNAPVDSIRGKLWAKLNATGRQDDYAGAATNMRTLPAVLTKGSQEMTVRRGICIASPLIIPIIKSVACGFSPDGELWVVKIFADPIESEVIYGHAFGNHFTLPPKLPSAMKSFFETHFLAREYALAFDQRALSAQLVGASQSHQRKQNILCDDEKAFAPEPYVHAISLSYFTSFIETILLVWIFAFILNIFQILTVNVKRPM